jgi:hypothetical protein
MKQHLIRGLGKWIGPLAVALTALPAAAQFEQTTPPPRAPACDAALCSASGLSLPALSEVARADTPPASVVPSGIRDELRRPDPARDPWNRHMPVRPDLESYDCILSLGVGGELSKGGFLGTRVLGQTQVWRKPADELKQ